MGKMTMRLTWSIFKLKRFVLRSHLLLMIVFEHITRLDVIMCDDTVYFMCSSSSMFLSKLRCVHCFSILQLIICKFLSPTDFAFRNACLIVEGRIVSTSPELCYNIWDGEATDWVVLERFC